MSAPPPPWSDVIDVGPRLTEALTYGALAIVVGEHPDSADEMNIEQFHIVPKGRTRRAISASDVATALRLAADQIEADGHAL